MPLTGRVLPGEDVSRVGKPCQALLRPCLRHGRDRRRHPEPRPDSASGHAPEARDPRPARCALPAAHPIELVRRSGSWLQAAAIFTWHRCHLQRNGSAMRTHAREPGRLARGRVKWRGRSGRLVMGSACQSQGRCAVARPVATIVATRRRPAREEMPARHPRHERCLFCRRHGQRAGTPRIGHASTRGRRRPAATSPSELAAHALRAMNA